LLGEKFCRLVGSKSKEIHHRHSCQYRSDDLIKEDGDDVLYWWWCNAPDDAYFRTEKKHPVNILGKNKEFKKSSPEYVLTLYGKGDLGK